MTTARLALFRPEWDRTCRDCRAWQYETDGSGEVMRRPYKVGLPVARARGIPTPCHECPKIPDDVPAGERDSRRAVEPTERSRAVLRHFFECRAVGEFPADDPIVRRHAVILRRLMDEWERQPVSRLLNVLASGVVKR